MGNVTFSQKVILRRFSTHSPVEFGQSCFIGFPSGSNAQPPFTFAQGYFVPMHKIHLYFLCGVFPKKTSMKFINTITDGARNGDILGIVRRNGRGDKLNDSFVTSQREEFCLPTFKLILDLLDNGTEALRVDSFINNGKSKIGA
ncbi:hypothetical protein ACH5RR_040470 [Cinchona calisaya]|uniref:Uncharacterized protein n=1 Tax=Cinchona calisaya TaxID=153742 RepID=A0ABD2XSS6_9GENT